MTGKKDLDPRHPDSEQMQETIALQGLPPVSTPCRLSLFLPLPWMPLLAGNNIPANRTRRIIPGFAPFVNPFSLDILARYSGLWQTIFEVQLCTGTFPAAPVRPCPPPWHSAARGEKTPLRYESATTLKLCGCYAASNGWAIAANRIKAWRPESALPVHVVPQYGPGIRETHILWEYRYLFKTSVQSVVWHQTRRAVPGLTACCPQSSMPTAAANSAGSTASWRREPPFSKRRRSQGHSAAQRIGRRQRPHEFSVSWPASLCVRKTRNRQTRAALSAGA